jgi:protein ImuA
MSGARTTTLATLRGRIAGIESPEVAASDGINGGDRVTLGHAGADAALQGGLARGAVHEIFSEGRQSAAATGFVAGLARRLGTRPLLWVRQDFAEREAGALSMRGFAELGLDPQRVVTVRAPDVETALRTTADALACDALGAVVMEIWGETQKFDLVASRKLTLAARLSGVTGLLLRPAAAPLPSTAETRWIVRAAHSPPDPAWSDNAWSDKWQSWGAPVLETHLVRNRHGPTGQWIMEWKCDECLFRESPAYPQPVAAAIADRPHRAPAEARNRRAG